MDRSVDEIDDGKVSKEEREKIEVNENCKDVLKYKPFEGLKGFNSGSVKKSN